MCQMCWHAVGTDFQIFATYIQYYECKVTFVSMKNHEKRKLVIILIKTNTGRHCIRRQLKVKLKP